MAEALIKGLIAGANVSAAQVLASDALSARLVHLSELYGIKVFSRNSEVAERSEILILAVKPVDAAVVLSEVAPELGPERLIISVVAGLTTRAIGDTLIASGAKCDVPVVRAMPNTPAMVGEAAVALCAGAAAGERETALAEELFASVGSVVVVEDEPLMDAVTALSGSGPAYVFLFIEALVEAGVKAGLTREDATTLAVQTTLGSARLAGQSKSTLAELREMVTSPGGTTIEGLRKLEEAGFKEALSSAVEAAAKRAAEISRSLEK